MQALNRPLSLALAGALLLCLTGCGQIRPSGTTDSAAPAAESDLLQFQVGRQSRTLAPGDHYDCRDGSTERLHIQTEETLDQLAGNITTSNGVTIGSTIDDVMERYTLRPGYANFNIALTAPTFSDYDTCLIYAFDCEEGHDTDDPAELQAGYVFEIELFYYTA